MQHLLRFVNDRTIFPHSDERLHGFQHFLRSFWCESTLVMATVGRVVVNVLGQETSIEQYVGGAMLLIEVGLVCTEKRHSGSIRSECGGMLET